MSTDSLHASSIVCESLSIRFQDGPAAVRDVDLQVPAGEILALIGPSGCGKTTILRLMAGLETPTSGSVVMDPPQTGDLGGVAFVFQQPTLLKWRTALENAMLPLELISDWRGRPASRVQGSGRQAGSRRFNGRTGARKAASDSLHSVGLTDASDRYPHQLSGGMRMRVSIARALVTEPRVLLLDEPFAALDDMLRSQLGQMVLELWKQQRFTAVMVTHNIAESILLSHRVAVMHEGRLTEVIENSLPWPRTETLRSTPEFGQLYGRVSRSLRRDG